MTVGAIVPTLDHAIFAQAIQSLQHILLANGYQLLIASHEYSAQAEAAATRSMLMRGVDALTLVGADHLDETWDLLTSASVPVLITWSREDRFPSLWFDNMRAGQIAAEHLIALGHQQIGAISGRRRWNDRARLRVAGTRAALVDAGLELPEWRIAETTFSVAGGRAGMAQLLAAAAPPTAVVCGNDIMAVGALFEAQSRGLRVPEDISIVGIDNLEISAHLSPALTTVHLPTAQLGAQAGELLIDALRGTTMPAQIELPIELVVRRSSGPAPVRRN
ncbi:substrate-binding domain-containing protein [Microvirga arabica]|uniref:substrate-binding domain-containing protein n=1 Tax=Microvirga arabica TaxID=1128671 RepID=UPI001FEA3193|nr:substrate-binding domain-containing protein [Microvirga arabica]